MPKTKKPKRGKSPDDAAFLALTSPYPGDVARYVNPYRGPTRMLTDAQKATLKADMEARPELAADLAAGNDVPIELFYNDADPSGDVCWKTSLSVDALRGETDWSVFKSLLAEEQRTWTALTQGNFLDPSDPTIRGAFAEIFSLATQAHVDQRAAYLAIAQRPMTRIEKLFAAGPAQGTYTLTYQGPIRHQTIGEIRRS